MFFSSFFFRVEFPPHLAWGGPALYEVLCGKLRFLIIQNAKGKRTFKSAMREAEALGPGQRFHIPFVFERWLRLVRSLALL